MDDDYGYSYYTPRVSFVFKLRQIFSHVTEIFSVFSKYIAPAIHHDRCERSVQMKLYNMHKREFVMVFIIFFAALGLSIFVGLAGPPITVTVEQRALQIDPNMTPEFLATGPFAMKSPSLSSYSQQLWVIGRFVMEHKEQFFQKDFYLSVSLQGITKAKTEEVLKSKRHRLRNETLACDHNRCQEFTILHLGFLEHTRYILNVSVNGLEGVQKWSPIHDVVFYFKTYEPAFTKLEIWCRFVFVFLSFLVTSWFAHSLRKYPVSDWSLEQKWLSVLLPMLLLYNDPIFPLIFLVDSWVPAFLDTVFQSTFLFSLLLFWLCIYHGLRQNHRNFYQFYVPKLAIVGWMWFCSVVVATAQKVSELKDPLYSAALHTNHFHTFKILFFIAAAIYVLYLVYFIVTAYSELRSMPFFGYGIKILLDNKCEATKKGGCCNPGIQKNESNVVHKFVMEDLGDKAVFCRCSRNSKFPYCDSSHTTHNENAGDNVGPLIVKQKDVRLKFLTILMIITVSVIVTVTALKFGVSPLEDNFVADLSTSYSSSAEFTAFYGLLNLYVFTCAFVYSPSERSMDPHVLKDNPALSMVNDSDEDVIYGSDDDTRRPLNRGGNENEESD